MEDYLRVGVITSPHGVKGEVKVFPTTDDPKRFKKLKTVYLVDKRGIKNAVNIESVKFFKQFVILKMKEYNSMDEVASLRQVDILIERKDAVPLKANENFIVDLIGLKVVEQETGEELGKLLDVLQTGANDVYVVDYHGKELLIPSIPQCILDVNIQEGVIKVHLLEGLLDL